MDEQFKCVRKAGKQHIVCRFCDYSIEIKPRGGVTENMFKRVHRTACNEKTMVMRKL